MSASANGKRGSRSEEREGGTSDGNRRVLIAITRSSPPPAVVHLSSLAPPPLFDLPVAGPRWLCFHVAAFIFLQLLAHSVRKWGVSSFAFYKAILLYIRPNITALMWLFSCGGDAFPKTPNSLAKLPVARATNVTTFHCSLVVLRLPSCSFST